jgi:hypothetical protein
MRSRLFGAILAVAVGAVVIAGPGVAGAHRGDAKTKITIIPQSDGFYGYIKSPKTQKCANNRKIKVVSDKNGDVIGRDIAQPNGDGIQWNIGNPGHMNGKFHAVAHAIPGCEKGESESVKMNPA